MTAGEFREVDQDLLADYVGGALDGTPQERAVARLVESDPAWAAAYAGLAPAVARVTADLAAWAEPAPEMPLAVRERLTAVLAGAGPATVDPTDATTVAPPRPDRAPAGVGGAGSEGRRPVPAQAGGPPRRTGGNRPTDPRPDPAGPGRGGRRWTRLAGPVALAAASVAALGLGVAQLVDSGGDTADTTSALPAGSAAADAAAFRFAGEPRRSGTDWTPEALAGGTAPPRITTDGPKLQPGDAPAGPPGEKRRATPGGLDRLADRAALDACLTEVSAAHGQGPVTVELVDYAAFRGEPALVLRFVDRVGERWAWVSGAECGVPGSGPDTRYQARVG